MEFVESIIWIIVNIAFPILPIAISFLFLKLFYKEFKYLKWYQFIARNDALALYASLISITSLLKPVFFLLSASSSNSLLSKQQQNILLFLIIFLTVVFLVSICFYCFLLSRNINIENLYSDENKFDDEQERMLALTIISLTTAAIAASFFMNLSI